jgi:hypothetical protein
MFVLLLILVITRGKTEEENGLLFMNLHIHFQEAITVIWGEDIERITGKLQRSPWDISHVEHIRGP